MNTTNVCTLDETHEHITDSLTIRTIMH